MSDCIATSAEGSRPVAVVADRYQPFQLEPLVELEVIGACRRGRRRGRRNRTAAERQAESEQRRRSKNARERQRVENVKNEYEKLQKLLGMESACLHERSREKTRYCKLRILTAAIHRIRALTELLRRADEGDSVSPHLHTTQPATSVESFRNGTDQTQETMPNSYSPADRDASLHGLLLRGPSLTSQPPNPMQLVLNQQFTHIPRASPHFPFFSPYPGIQPDALSLYPTPFQVYSHPATYMDHWPPLVPP